MKKSETKSYKFHQPSNWPGLLFFALVKLVAALPLTVQIWTGRVVGNLIYFLARRRRAIAKTNLNLCFAEKDEDWRKKLLKANLRLTGLSIVETAACWFSDLNSRLARTSVVGMDNLEKALERKKGVILLSFHMTSLEVGGCLAGHFVPLSAMYKPNRNPLIEYFMCRGRKRHVKQLVKQNDVRGAVKALKDNQILWYATDQNYGTKSTIFVPFFGVQASTITATTKFVKLSGASVVPFTQKRSADGKSFELTFHPALSDFPGASERDDALRLNRFLETCLQEDPLDYMWLHQRFRTRPPGEEPIYPARKR